MFISELIVFYVDLSSAIDWMLVIVEVVLVQGAKINCYREG
jgi:hypothetical protein